MPNPVNLPLPTGRIASFFILCLGLVTSASGQRDASTFPTNGTKDKSAVRWAMEHATVHISPDQVMEDATIVIHRGRIEAVGPSAEIKLEGPVVRESYAGMHIYSSFVELDSDWALPAAPGEKRGRGPQDLSDKKGAYGWNEAIRPEVQAQLDFDPTSESAQSERVAMIEAGFGAVLTHVQDGIVRGAGSLVALGSQPHGSLLIPKATTHFSFRKGTSSQDYPRSLMGAIALLKQTAFDAEWHENQQDAGGVAEQNLSLQAFVDNQTLPKFFQAGGWQDALRALNVAEELGWETPWVIHAGNDLYQRLPSFVDRDCRVVLSLDFPKAFDVADPYLSRWIGLDELKHWELAPYNTLRVWEAGIPFAISSAGLENPKQEWLGALRQVVGTGVPAAEVLRAITTTPAQWLDASDQIGQVAPGFVANLLVFDGPMLTAESALMENIVLGDRHVFRDRNAVDLTGSYEANIDGHLGVLEVEQSKKKGWKASFRWVADSTAIPLEISLENRQLTMGLRIDTLGHKGQVRMWGNVWMDSRIWEGSGAFPDGSPVTWSAIKLSEGDVAVAPADSSKTPELPQLGEVVRPFMAYGNSNQPVEETLWIQNATLWTCGPAGILESGEIIIHKGKIVAVGEQLDLASIFGAKSNIRPVVMDARGMHITPGIIDEHSHIAVSRGINEGTQASSAEVEIGSAINSEDINIYRQLAGGVTTSQLLHGSANPIGGQSALIKLRWGEDADGLKFEDAPGFIKFALGENVKQSNWGDDYRSRFPQTRMGVEQVYYDLFIQAMEYKSRWQQYERERSNLSLRARWRGEVPVAPRRDLEMETLVEILDGQRHITCHSYRQDEINMLMHVADSLGFKINTFTHILEGYKVADKLAAHGAGGSTFSDWWAYKYEVKDAIPYNGAVLHGQGVVTAINSDDDEMARRLNQEAAKAVKYGGVSEEEALKFVTLNPAKLLRIDDRVGSLEVGKDADLVVWDDHPLSMYAQVEQTFIDGCRYFDVAEDQAKRAWMKSERARLMEAMQSPDQASGEKRQPAERIRPDYHCDTLTDENK